MKRCWLPLLGLLLLSRIAAAEISREEELALGRQAARKLEAQLPVDYSPQLNSRVRRVGRSLIEASPRLEGTYRFKVLKSDQFNALALPGGFIYVTAGLAKKCSDGELAFVLGHELSHVTCRHAVHQLEGEQLRQLGFVILVGLGGGRLSSQAAGAAQVVDQVLSSRYSQADEAEADRRALEIMSRAGYDPAWGLLALQRIAALPHRGMPQFVNAMAGTHPLPQERIQAALRHIPQVSYGEAARPWRNDLARAVAEGTGLSEDAGLNVEAARELDTGQIVEEGSLLLSAPGETYGQLERRFLTQEVSGLTMKQPQAKSFGLAVHTGLNGEKLVWIRVR